jgi:hypothetical protein
VGCIGLVYTEGAAVVTLSSIRLWRLGKWIARVDDDDDGGGRFERLDAVSVVVVVVVVDMMTDTSVFKVAFSLAIKWVLKEQFEHMLCLYPSFFTFFALKQNSNGINLS